MLLQLNIEKLPLKKLIGMQSDEAKKELYKNVGSKNKVTRIINDPSIAIHSELLSFAHCLGIAAQVLVDHFKMGKKGMHHLEKELYKTHNKNPINEINCQTKSET